jgi:hypothetical protein
LAPGGQRWDGFGFFEFGPLWTGPFGPYGTVDRGPCGTVDRPGLDQTGPDQTVFNTLLAPRTHPNHPIYFFPVKLTFSDFFLKKYQGTDEMV